MLYVFQENCICVVYKYLQVKQDNIKLPRRHSYMHQTSTEKDENILDTENLNVTIKFSHQPTNKYNEKNITQTKVDKNYSDILDVELGKKYSYMSSGLVDLFSGKILKFPKHFGDIFARAVSAIEHSEEDEVFKELFLELLKKPPYKHKPSVNNKKSSSTRVLLVSSWSSGSR